MMKGRNNVAKTSFTPFGDRLLVKVEEAETKVGNIFLAETAQEKPNTGVVIVVGPGKKEKGELVPMYVQAGDRIIFGKYAGSPIKIDGEELLILKEDEVFGRLK